jgi:CDP-paratose 2-epimerase
MATRSGNKGAQGPEIGILEWFWFNDKAAVEQAVADLKRLGVKQLRFGFSWADFFREDGQAWFDYLVPKLAEVGELLPSFVYTPPSLGEQPYTASPPRDLKAFADFIDVCISRYGQYFDYVELWNEPNNIREWDASLDWSWEKFATMIINAGNWARARGKKTVLGGMSPIDPNWLHTMFRLGVMEHIDVVGIHGFPGSYDVTHEPWSTQIKRIQSLLDNYGSKARIWITEVGYPTWRNDDYEQIRVFNDLLDLPVERAYWLCLQDLPGERPSTAGFHRDPRDYHFGIRSEGGEEKLLYRIWESGGIQAIRRAAHWAHPVGRISQKRDELVLVTGGAGFVGSNLVDRLIRDGRPVRVVDNLSRPGVEKNLEWLQERHGNNFEFVPADLRNTFALTPAVEGVSQIFHLAGQVAVTTSLVDPIRDFNINLKGTLNLLEAARKQPKPPGIVFSSTNKVYGGLPDVGLALSGNRYEPENLDIRRNGIGEDRNLDFHSPYGCSKGGADQYIIDYARCMGVKAAVMRMSCIYGPRQFGTEDQGWVAHFLIRAIKGEPITIYGDGKQVRDILFVDDLVNAFLLAEQNLDAISAQAFNIGGGCANTISLLNLIDMIGELNGHVPEIHFADWRPGDQRYYCSDTRKFQQATGWHAQVSAREGVRRLYEWLTDSYVVGGARPVERRLAL